MNAQPETTKFELTTKQVVYLRQLIENEIEELEYQSRFCSVIHEEKMTKDLLLIFTKP